MTWKELLLRSPKNHPCLQDVRNKNYSIDNVRSSVKFLNRFTNAVIQLLFALLATIIVNTYAKTRKIP